MSMWDMMKESARIDARKGDQSGMNDIKRVLRDDYKKSDGTWMNDEEKRMIGKYKSPTPIKIDLDGINKGRLLPQEMRHENKRLDQQRKKIFEKKSSHENIGGLEYLLNTKGQHYKYLVSHSTSIRLVKKLFPIPCGTSIGGRNSDQLRTLTGFST